MDLEALMRALLSGDNGSVADQRVVDARVGDQVGLELVQVDIECTIESQTRCNRADNLGNQTVEVFVVRAGNVQAATADIVDGLVVDEERAVRVLNGTVRRKDGIVRLDDRRRNTRGRIDGELKLALLAVVGGKTLENEGTESRSGPATE